MFPAFRMRYNTALTVLVMQMIHCDNVLCMTPCLCTGNLFAAVTLAVETLLFLFTLHTCAHPSLVARLNAIYSYVQITTPLNT